MPTETRFSFTQDRLAKLVCPPSGRPAMDGQAWFRDDKVPGLAYMVSESGAKSFYWYRKVNGKPRRIRLGKPADMNVEKARRRAGELNSQIAQGRDPAAEKQAARDKALKQASIGELWQSYRDHHLVQCKPGTVKEFDRLYTLHIAPPWASRAVASIATADVEKLKMAIGEKHGHYTANRCLAIISSMYRKRGHAFGLLRNWTPTAGVDRFPEMPRDRVLTTAELGKIMQAIDADDNDVVRDYFKMLVYTGMRKMSVARMAWADLNIPGGTWKLPGEKTKNGRPLVVNLIPEAITIIQRRYDENPPDHPFVFPARRITPEQVAQARHLRECGQSTRAIADATGINQTSVVRVLKPEYTPSEPSAFDGAGVAWTRILKRAGIMTRTSIHDLRRTFCTSLIEAGVPLPVVSAAMGHRTMETTSRHYSFASDKTVADAVRSSMAGLLANVAKAQTVKPARKSA